MLPVSRAVYSMSGRLVDVAFTKEHPDRKPITVKLTNYRESQGAIEGVISQLLEDAFPGSTVTVDITERPQATEEEANGATK